MQSKTLKKALNALTTDRPPTAERQNVREKAQRWLDADGVQGVAVGEKTEAGMPTGQTCIKVFVEQKRPKKELDNPVPRRVTIPGLDEKVDIDVEEIGEVRADYRPRRRPAPNGVSISHSNVGYGTSCCLVAKRGTQSPLFILGNCHVLADLGRASVGDPIFQPGVDDQPGSDETRIAALHSWVNIDWASTGYPNSVDAAIAQVRDRRMVSPEILRIGRLAGIGTTIRRGMEITKSGRTTEETTGKVQATGYMGSITYKGGYKARFRDLVVCTRYGSSGDSGAAVINRANRIIGLHIGGSDRASLFCPISSVFRAFDVYLVR